MNISLGYKSRSGRYLRCSSNQKILETTLCHQWQYNRKCDNEAKYRGYHSDSRHTDQEKYEDWREKKTHGDSRGEYHSYSRITSILEFKQPFLYRLILSCKEALKLKSDFTSNLTDSNVSRACIHRKQIHACQLKICLSNYPLDFHAGWSIHFSLLERHDH